MGADNIPDHGVRIRLDQYNHVDTLTDETLVAGEQNQKGVKITMGQIVLYVNAVNQSGDGFIMTNGAPSNAVGHDGQYALDLPNGYFYGPKNEGVWPTATAIAAAALSITSTPLDAFEGNEIFNITLEGQPYTGTAFQLMDYIRNNMVMSPPTDAIDGGDF